MKHNKCRIIRKDIWNLNNYGLLFLKNAKENKTVYLDRGTIYIRHRAELCNGSTINKIIKELNNAFEKHNNNIKKIVFVFGKVTFADKLVYITFECLCYELVSRGIKVQLNADLREKNIFKAGIAHSPLNCLIDSSKNYIDKFEKKDISLNHYRRIVSGDEKRDSTVFCTIMKEVRTCLSVFADSQYCRDVAEMVSELAGNAVEHARADCLIDIDIVTNCYNRKQLSDAVLCGINVVIVNCSEVLLGDALKSKIKNNSFDKDAERYVCLQQAFHNHSSFFSEKYTEEDFFNLAAFQNKISGRPSGDKVGGTGLPVLVKSIEKQSKLHTCYVATGKNILWFREKYLEYNEGEWIGFNKEKDFLNSKPDITVLGRGDTFFPGTAFNLSFGIEQEEFIYE